MKAVRLHGHGGTELLRLEDVPLPRVGEWDVLVASISAALITRT